MLGHEWTSYFNVNAKIGIGIIIYNYKAEEVFKQLNQTMFFVDYLSEQYYVLDKNCSFLSEKEKEVLIDCCRQTGCSEKYVKGLGDCGLLISLQHGCPNNSLPILWHNRKGWINLFHRRTI